MRKAIPGFEGHYEIDRQGNIFSIKRNKILTPSVAQSRNKGYSRISLSKDSVAFRIMVHRLVAQTFIDNPYQLTQVNHKDRNTFNNSVDNLEWCTPQQNSEHSLSKDYSFISPLNEVVKIFNLTKFCRDNNLTQSLMWKVYFGQRKQHKGWRKTNELT